VNVLKDNLRVTIDTLASYGVSHREIARRTGVDRKTIRRYTRGAIPPGWPPAPRPSPLKIPTPATGSRRRGRGGPGRDRLRLRTSSVVDRGAGSTGAQRPEHLPGSGRGPRVLPPLPLGQAVRRSPEAARSRPLRHPRVPSRRRGTNRSGPRRAHATAGPVPSAPPVWHDPEVLGQSASARSPVHRKEFLEAHWDVLGSGRRLTQRSSTIHRSTSPGVSISSLRTVATEALPISTRSGTTPEDPGSISKGIQSAANRTFLPCWFSIHPRVRWIGSFRRSLASTRR